MLIIVEGAGEGGGTKNEGKKIAWHRPRFVSIKTCVFSHALVNTGRFFFQYLTVGEKIGIKFTAIEQDWF